MGQWDKFWTKMFVTETEYSSQRFLGHAFDWDLFNQMYGDEAVGALRACYDARNDKRVAELRVEDEGGEVPQDLLERVNSTDTELRRHIGASFEELKDGQKDAAVEVIGTRKGPESELY